MTYSKPEVAVLGDASTVIQGFKGLPTDSGVPIDPGPNLFEHEE